MMFQRKSRGRGEFEIGSLSQCVEEEYQRLAGFLPIGTRAY